MRICALICLMCLGLAAPVAADRISAPGEILLLSDEIFGNSVNVTRPSDGTAPSEGSGGGDINSRSGFGDDSNPADASTNGQSGNPATDNPGGN